MRRTVLGIAIALSVTVGVAGQTKAAVQEKPASSTPLRVPCDSLLQHPLAWWLGSTPTSAERDQLAACLAGSGQLAAATASPSLPVAPATAATQEWPAPSPGQDKPANWNTMNAQQQAWWLCRDDPTRITDRCKRVTAETAAQTPSLSSPVPVAQWTVDTCESERQSLSLLSDRINRSIAQLQAAAALPAPASPVKAPPTYRCESDRYGSQTTTTCAPEKGYASPGAAFSEALAKSVAERAAERRLTAFAANIEAQQRQFDARFQERESHCTKR